MARRADGTLALTPAGQDEVSRIIGALVPGYASN
jgi:hypothetical protein